MNNTNQYQALNNIPGKPFESVFKIKPQVMKLREKQERLSKEMAMLLELKKMIST